MLATGRENLHPRDPTSNVLLPKSYVAEIIH